MKIKKKKAKKKTRILPGFEKMALYEIKPKKVRR
jgi:hypothetical protein